MADAKFQVNNQNLCVCAPLSYPQDTKHYLQSLSLSLTHSRIIVIIKYGTAVLSNTHSSCVPPENTLLNKIQYTSQYLLFLCVIYLETAESQPVSCYCYSILFCIYNINIYFVFLFCQFWFHSHFFSPHELMERTMSVLFLCYYVYHMCVCMSPLVRTHTLSYTCRPMQSRVHLI